jgi:hypothetical protein
MNVNEIIEEVEIFIEENENEFEFIVDINNNEYYEINFNKLLKIILYYILYFKD